MRFVCIRKCFTKDIMYQEGQKLNVGKDQIEICPVCEGTKMFKDRECVKCQGTGRAFPPHHFKQLGDITKQQKVDMEIAEEDEPDAEEPEGEVEDVTEDKLEDMTKAELRAELKALGKSCSPNASKTTLVTQVKLARTGKT